MRLIDVFLPVIAQLKQAEEALTSESILEADELRQSLLNVLNTESFDENLQQYSENEFLLAQFAVVAWIDELILSSDWQHKELWAQELLQYSFYNTTTAGRDFFENLDSLNEFNPIHNEIREVYLYCLALGFKGQYFEPGSQALLDNMIQKNYQLVVPLLPETDNLVVASQTFEFKPDKKISMRAKAQTIIWVPLVVLAGSYLFFRYDISSTIQEIIKAV